MRHSVKNEPVSTDKQYINYILFKTICKVFFLFFKTVFGFCYGILQKRKELPMRSYVIYLIRHGAVDETLRGRYIGSTDVHLSEKGKKALRQTSDIFGYPYPEQIYSSPLSRCVETCSIIYPKREIKTVGALSECDFGDWEGKSAKELADNPVFGQWLQNSDKTPPPNGESGAEFAKRVCKGFERIVEEMSAQGTKTASVVTHGGVIMTLLSVYGLPQAESYKWRMDNGYGFAVRITPLLWMRDRVMEVYDTVPFEPKPKGQEMI